MSTNDYKKGSQGSLVEDKSPDYGDDMDSKLVDTKKLPLTSYNILQQMSYSKINVEEWISRIKKYKAETLRYANFCRITEIEITELQNKLANLTTTFQNMDVQIEELKSETAALLDSLQEEKTRRDTAASECLQLKQASEYITKQTDTILKNTSQTREQLELLKGDLKKKQQRHQDALAEEERLKFEKRWFLYERILLEQTRRQELEKMAGVQENFINLKIGLEKLWNDTREIELLSRLRNTKRNIGLDEWYAARQRRFNISRKNHSISVDNPSSVQ